VDARLANELRAVLGGRLPVVADLPALRYTEMIVAESMRLYPTGLRDWTSGGAADRGSRPFGRGE
jgi:hypothetical protein